MILLDSKSGATAQFTRLPLGYNLPLFWEGEAAAFSWDGRDFRDDRDFKDKRSSAAFLGGLGAFVHG
ncbi:MAG: hypothetical protein IJV69_01015 [Kiritimatiellae bacterium]|nr:hypothetical protein [Kiritimatiellia bacterium]